jgi:hypothetical protein
MSFAHTQAKAPTKALEKRDSVVSHVKKESSRPANSPVNHILQLQETVGNQAVRSLIESGYLQAKLRIGQPEDEYEREADRVANVIMQMPEPRTQRQAEPEKEEKEILQTKVSRGQSPETTANLESRIEPLQADGEPLRESDRNFFESRFGYDFSRVKVHSGARAAEAARAVNARAYTAGHIIVFGTGQYAPETREGRKLLAHELKHVVQQTHGRNAPNIQFQEEEYHGVGGWLHEQVYEPLQRDYAAWITWGNNLPSRWGEKIPVAGHVAGAVVGFIPWVFGSAGTIIVAVPQFLTPKTMEEHFLTAVSMGAGTPAVRVGRGISYGCWWLRNLLKKNPAIERKIIQTSPKLTKEVFEKVEQKAPTAIKTTATKKTATAGEAAKEAIGPKSGLVGKRKVFLMPEGKFIGKIPVPKAPTPQVLGQKIEQPIRKLVAERYGFRLDPKKVSATGPDIVVPEVARKRIGFDIADIKPLNKEGLLKFWDQLDSWRDFGWAGGPQKFKGKAAMFGYDEQGYVYLYGIFEL